MKKISLFLMAATLLLSSFFLGCQNNVATDITTGSVQGSVTLNGTTDEVLGLDVFIAGTSFVSKVAADGKYEISNIPAKSGYILCVQKEDFTKIISENVEIKEGEVTIVDPIDVIIEKSEEEIDQYNGIFDLENFIPEKFLLTENQYSNGARENHVDLKYDKIIPNLGDKITLSFDFTSDKDIDILEIRFVDPSEAANWWLELVGENKEDWLLIKDIKAGEEIKVNHTFTLKEKPVNTIRLNFSTQDKRFNEVNLKISNSKLKVTSPTGIPSFIEKNSQSIFSCTPTKEGIKFGGSLLSNIQDQTAKCTIIIRDTENNVQMERQYSLANSNAYESWEMTYPLVEKDKEYTFEITTKCDATTIGFEKFTVTAIGGLGEYKIENADTYTVTLSEDKKTLTRTPQEFTVNPDVQNLVIDYGTKYAVYSNNDSATTIWDGIWRHDSIYWASSTNQKCDLTTFGWPSYVDLDSSLKGRRLGTRTETHMKLAGYTYNGTTEFIFNDYKETFFDWDDEEQYKYFVLYKDPKTGEYYEDVPGTSLYYIKEELDENGNVIFAEKDAEGAIEVYGQLISYGDKIYEPAYVPATEIEDHIFSGFWDIDCESQKITSTSFPYSSNDIWAKKEFVPVYLTPVYKPYKFNIHFVDENGDELLPSIKTSQQKVRIESRPPERTNYSCNYYWKDSLSEDATEIKPWEDLNLTKYDTYLYAKYELSRIELRFLNEDGSIFEINEKYSHEFSVEKDKNTIYMTQDYTYTPYQKPVSSEENKVFDYWECETEVSFTAGQSISSIGKISDVINFYPVFREAQVRTAYFYDENGNQILDPIVRTETNSNLWYEFYLPSIPEKEGYNSTGKWRDSYGNYFEPNEYYSQLQNGDVRFYAEYYATESEEPTPSNP